MRLSILLTIAFSLFASTTSVSSQDKSKANDEHRETTGKPSNPQPPPPTIQINVGSPIEPVTTQSTQQETKEKSRPPITNGEWLIASITAVYVLISYFTFRAIRNSSERQLRAYVLPENAGLYDGSQITPQPVANKINAPGIAMLIKNSGQTPAYSVVSSMQIAVIPPGTENTLEVNPLGQKFTLTLGANGTFTKTWWFERPLIAAEIADIAIGAKAIYLYGRIEYRDAFKKSHFSNFRLHYIGQFPPPQPNAMLNFSLSGNDSD
jgi:hypothetical protein